MPQIIICVLVSDFVLNAQLENHKPDSQKLVCFASWAEYPFKKALIINFHEQVFKEKSQIISIHQHRPRELLTDCHSTGE